MSKKWHTGPNGPGICRASEGNCPFGGPESHYATKEEAQAKFDREQADEFGLLPEEKDSGIAKDISNKYPDAKEAALEDFARGEGNAYESTIGWNYDNVVGPTLESDGVWYEENAPLYDVYKKEFGEGTVHEVSDGKHNPLDYSLDAFNDYPGSYITDAKEAVSKDLNEKQKSFIV